MNIIIDIEQGLLSEALRFCGATGFDAFVAEALRAHMAEDDIDVPVADVSMLDRAVAAARLKAAGAEFLLIDLFSTADWQAVPPGERKSLGRAFRKAVESAGIAQYLQMTDTRKALYRRI